MQPTTVQPPSEFKRLRIFDKEEFIIRPGDISSQDFHTLARPPFLVRYKLQKGWAIFQYYVDQEGLFPITAESALLHVVGPTQLPFFLDWTMEAISWFIAVDFNERPMMMSKVHLDKIASDCMEGIKAQPMPPEQSVARFQNMLRLRRSKHREHMSQYPVGVGVPRP